MTKIALGTVQFGMAYGVANASGKIEHDEAARILQLASRHGIDTLDTAVAYGDSEASLGAVGVQGWKVISKLPGLPSGCADPAAWVESQVRGSLHRLQVDRLYGLMLHRPTQLLEPAGDVIYRVLCALRERGVVEKVGVSVYEPSELDLLFANKQFDLVQAPLNILDQRLQSTGWVDRLQSMGCELHVRSVFLQGLLLMSPARRPAHFNRWHSLWSAWDGWLGEHGLTPLQACLGYALNTPGIDRAVLGVDSMIQLQQILDAAGRELPTLPAALQTDDYDLLNPSRWTQE